MATLLGASALLCSKFLALHAALSSQATLSLSDFKSHEWFPGSGYGWWAWWDQRYYLEAALAWSQGVLDPARHWYLPGYPLLGAPFTRVTPADPFLLPDLGCMLASLWLFASLGRRLLGAMPHGRAAAALVFSAAVAFSPQALWSWVVPWTTTPETACIFACLLATARFIERPSRADAFIAAAFGAVVSGVRPADALVVVLASGAGMAAAASRPWPGLRRVAGLIGAAFAGGLIPAIGLGSAYVAIYGFHASGYVTLSSEIGFEWRLLPIRWVTLMISPKPMFPTSQGMAEVFPWIVPGLAGMAASLAVRGGTRDAPWRLHAMVAAAASADCAMLLAYRDLHRTGLFRFGNFHYFKWLLPVFGLYALILVRALTFGRRLRAAGASVCVAAGLVMWRVEVTHPVALPSIADARRVELPDGLSRMDDVVLGKASGDLAKLYFQTSAILVGGAAYPSFFDYKVFAWSGDLMIIPLRPMPAAASTLELPDGVALDAAVTPIMARQTLVWGLPCWLLPERGVCRFPDLLPASSLQPGVSVSLAGPDVDLYTRTGWSTAEKTGRWTEGRRATLAFRLAGRTREASGKQVVTVNGSGFVPAGEGPTEVTFSANGQTVARQPFDSRPTTARIRIPEDTVRADGSVTLELAIANPRRPADHGAMDARELGVFVQSFQVDDD